MELQRTRGKKDIAAAGLDIQKIKGQKFIWRIKKIDQALVSELAQQNNICLPVAHALVNRNYKTSEQIQDFIFCTLEKDVPAAQKLKGISAAVERILRAIEGKEKILIFGDYDVDGITSTSLILAALLPLGAAINYFLPMRKDGYGLSVDAVNKAFSAGYKLIVTVDNGITAFDAAKSAKALGIDLIVTDHHQPLEILPDALAIVNPNQKDCDYPYKELAGVGVAFKLVSMIYEIKKLLLPDKIYELLMLGTIADVTPLVGENRYWVKFGLGKINKRQSSAFTVLAQNANLLKTVYSSLDVGFMIAPQINALGRLSDPRQAVRFLVSSDTGEVSRIGSLLKEVNEERKKVERQIYEEIEYQILSKKINLKKENIIVAASSQWPTGIIGLVAGKLAQNYGKPTLLFHLNNGIAAGSCRSVQDFDLFKAFEKFKDLLISFGGHTMAAGLRIKQENLPLFKVRLEEEVLLHVPAEDLAPKIDIDGFVQLPELTKKLIFDLEQLEPFGNKNPQPVFLVKNVTQLKPPLLLKDLHVKCTIFADGVIKPVIFFNRPELFKILQDLQDKPFDVVGYVIKNEWEGSVQIELQGMDVAL